MLLLSVDSADIAASLHLPCLVIGKDVHFVQTHTLAVLKIPPRLGWETWDLSLAMVCFERLACWTTIRSVCVLCDYIGLLFHHPTHEVQQLTKEVGMDGRLRTIAFGVQDNSHLSEIWQTLKDCMESGNWLILQNAHLSQGLWTGKLLHLLQVWQS